METAQGNSNWWYTYFNCLSCLHSDWSVFIAEAYNWKPYTENASISSYPLKFTPPTCHSLTYMH